MKPVVQHVAIELANGPIAIMQFFTRGDGIPDREPTPANIEAEIAKAGLQPTSWRLIDEAEAASIRASRPRPEPKAWVPDTSEPSQPAYPEPQPITIEQERDRRIALGFHFEGSDYPATPDDYSRIASYVAQATAAITMGVQAGDFYWHGGDSEFTWTDMNSIPVPFDAQQMIAFGRAANAHRMRLDRKAEALKANPPPDITDNAYWI